MAYQEDELETGEEIRTSRFTEVVALLFVTVVLLALSIKILFF